MEKSNIKYLFSFSLQRNERTRLIVERGKLRMRVESGRSNENDHLSATATCWTTEQARYIQRKRVALFAGPESRSELTWRNIYLQKKYIRDISREKRTTHVGQHSEIPMRNAEHWMGNEQSLSRVCAGKNLKRMKTSKIEKNDLFSSLRCFCLS